MVLLFSLTGLLQIQTTGNIVDDLPDQDRVIQDLKWIEARFGGSMPFEVMVDTGKPNGATSNASMKRIEKLQDVLREYPEFSRSVSAADATKFAFQAFKNGHPKKLPSSETGHGENSVWALAQRLSGCSRRLISGTGRYVELL